MHEDPFCQAASELKSAKQVGTPPYGMKLSESP
jgi:hypothetical protein